MISEFSSEACESRHSPAKKKGEKVLKRFGRIADCTVTDNKIIHWLPDVPKGSQTSGYCRPVCHHKRQHGACWRHEYSKETSLKLSRLCATPRRATEYFDRTATVSPPPADREYCRVYRPMHSHLLLLSSAIYFTLHKSGTG